MGGVYLGSGGGGVSWEGARRAEGGNEAERDGLLPVVEYIQKQQAQRQQGRTPGGSRAARTHLHHDADEDNEGHGEDGGQGEEAKEMDGLLGLDEAHSMHVPISVPPLSMMRRGGVHHWRGEHHHHHQQQHLDAIHEVVVKDQPLEDNSTTTTTYRGDIAKGGQSIRER